MGVHEERTEKEVGMCVILYIPRKEIQHHLKSSCDMIFCTEYNTYVHNQRQGMTQEAKWILALNPTWLMCHT